MKLGTVLLVAASIAFFAGAALAGSPSQGGVRTAPANSTAWSGHGL